MAESVDILPLTYYIKNIDRDKTLTKRDKIMTKKQETEAQKKARIERNQEIATTIVQQLGGAGRMKAMLGFKQLIAIDNGLTIVLPARFAKDGINRVDIVLNGKDLYDMKFWKLGRAPHYKVTTVSESKDNYFDMLQSEFREHTGLALSL